MKNIYFAFFLLLISNSLLSQTTPPTIQWQKCLGGSNYDQAYSIHQTIDRGYIISGTTTSNDGDVTGNHDTSGHTSDAWLVKLDSSGNIQWQKCFGGTGHDGALSLQPCLDGGYIFAGSTSSNDGDVSGNHGLGDFWVVKLDSSVNIQWQKCLGGSYMDSAYAIQQTFDKGYIVAGYTLSNDGDVSGNHGGYDFWIVKLDTSGNLQWQRCYGGSAQDIAYSIVQTNDRGYIIAGSTTSNDGDVSGNHDLSSQYNDCLILKIDSAGNIQWQRCLGGTTDDGAYSIKPTNDGGYIIGGYANSNNGDVTGNHGWADFWLVKLDSSGNILWQKCLGGTYLENAFSAQQTNDGGFIVTGSASSNDGDVSGNYDLSHQVIDLWVVKLSPAPLIVNEPALSEEDIIIYPNPSTSMFHVKLPAGSVNVKIYNLMGEELLQRNVSDTRETEFNLKGNGIYFINFITGKSVFTRKIVIRGTE